MSEREREREREGEGECDKHIRVVDVKSYDIDTDKISSSKAVLISTVKHVILLH